MASKQHNYWTPRLGGYLEALGGAWLLPSGCPAFVRFAVQANVETPHAIGPRPMGVGMREGLRHSRLEDVAATYERSLAEAAGAARP